MTRTTVLPDPSPPAAPRPRAALDDGPAPRRPVNWRSVLLGLAGVLFINLLTGFNDYAVNNTNLIGSHLPVAVVMLLFVFVVGINAPLRRLAPRHAFGSHELAVALGMMLIGCALPSVGLYRYLPGHLTAFFFHAGNDANDAALLRQLDLPDWLFPTMAERDPVARALDPVVSDYANRIPLGEATFFERVGAVPWPAWVRPLLSWGILIGCLAGAGLCLSVIFRRQWVENERLPFPLASIYLSLIEDPAPGRALNGLFRSRGFWIAAGAVFFVHSVNALHAYDSKLWPQIPLGYDFNTLFSEPPWAYLNWAFKRANVFFMIVGIMLFVQTKVAFSLWFFYVAMQVVTMGYGTYQHQVTGGMEQDQLFGAIVPFALTAVWVGRHHLAVVARQMFRPPRDGEPRGRYLPYAAAGWGAVLFAAGMVTWFVLAGTTIPGAFVIVVVVLMTLMVVARVVAETGLLYVLIPLEIDRPWLYALADVPKDLAHRTTLHNYFFSRWMFGLGLQDTRESLPGYATHAMRIADEDAYTDERDWRRVLPFTASLVLAWVVAFVVGGASMVYVEYSYASTLDQSQLTPINDWGARRMANEVILDPTYRYVPPAAGPQERHSRLGYFAFGAGLTTALAVLRLRYTWWPLHPVGYLLVNTWGIRMIWFSILIGWLAKVLIVRFGGTALFARARPAFLGLIIGEAVAAGVWLVVALVRLSMGLEYYPVRILPI